MKSPSKELKRIVRNLLDEINEGREQAKREPITEMAFQPLNKNMLVLTTKCEQMGSGRFQHLPLVLLSNLCQILYLSNYRHF